MGFQSRKSPNFGDFGTPTWESWDKKPFGCGLWASHRVYYKGEGGGFPQVWAIVSLMCPCCPWLVLAPKVLQLCTNHLVLVLCTPVWVSEACQLFLVPSWSSSTPLYPSKCCERRSVPRLLPILLFFIWTHIWVLQGVGNVSHALILLEDFKCFFQYDWFFLLNLFLRSFIIMLKLKKIVKYFKFEFSTLLSSPSTHLSCSFLDSFSMFSQ
jgi:hypothetical protein